MKIWGFGTALTISVGTALLGGCGGSQSIGAPGAMPETAATASARAAHHLSASYELMYRFHPKVNGEHPSGGLLDVGGTLYGTTADGGSSGDGTVYSISTRGVQKVIYSFKGGSDGAHPTQSLLDVNGTLYGTTSVGGGWGCNNGNCGTVYSISTSGTEKVVYAFKGDKDGAIPYAGLIDVNGTLYGTTSEGGGFGCYDSFGCGTVYSVSTSGAETVLHSFAGGSDGGDPEAALIDVNGVLYGTTQYGGLTTGPACPQWHGCGTVYSVTTSGKEKVLYRFQGGSSDGAWPVSGLTNMNGMLYGTTSGYHGTECGIGCGTVYQISTSGSGYSVLHGFQGEPDGGNPTSSLIAIQGTLYGTTYSGGSSSRGCLIGYGCGTIYSINASGVETVLYRFPGYHNGAGPSAPLTNVNGILYGTTSQGGSDDCCNVYGYGTVFALTP